MDYSSWDCKESDTTEQYYVTHPGDLPDPGIKPLSLLSPALAGGFLTASTLWEALLTQLGGI